MYLNALRAREQVVSVTVTVMRLGGGGGGGGGGEEREDEDDGVHVAPELAKDGPRRDDPEADPDAPDVAAEHRDDLVPEELQEIPEPDKRTTFSCIGHCTVPYSLVGKTGRT